MGEKYRSVEKYIEDITGSPKCGTCREKTETQEINRKCAT